MLAVRKERPQVILRISEMETPRQLTAIAESTLATRVREVRIQFPPAESPRTIGSCGTLRVRRQYPEAEAIVIEFGREIFGARRMT